MKKQRRMFQRREVAMFDVYITEDQAKMIFVLGLDMDKWTGKKYFEKIPGTTHQEWCEEELIMKEVTDYAMFPKMRIDEAAKYLREKLGIDIVISPRFNSETGDKIGYFWRWSQRTDVNLNPKLFRTYEAALSDALNVILNQIIPDYGKSN